MPDFSKNAFATPFGRNVFLRSTQDVKTISYTVARATVMAETIDGHPDQKVLQPGTVLAKITSGPDAGKVGPFQTGALDGRQTVANIVGINNTFLPWQLTERDVEVAVIYEASVVQANCIEYADATTKVALTNATAAEMIGKKSLDIKFF